MTYLHFDTTTLCVPHVDKQTTKRRKCPTCKARRTFYCWFQEWYGWHVTCLGCGEQWQDGQMCERPFSPGWRKKNIEHAKRALVAKP